MKLLKRTISILSATLLSVASVTAISAFADNSTHFYAELAYETSTRVRVDIMLDNFPAIQCGGFHVALGEGLEFVMDPDASDKLLLQKDGTYGHYIGSWSTMIDGTMDNGVFICFASSQTYPMVVDMPIISFYADKLAGYDEEDMTATIIAKANNNAEDMLYYTSETGSGTTSTTVNLTDIDKPVMISSVDYLVGDVNNDGSVNAVDASCILVAMRNNFNVPISVHSIDSHFNMFFPNAKTKESPDANKDELIARDDADEIMDYYSAMASNQPYNGYVGQTDYYETYV